tara:strand:- start:14617 stop:14850 length:234 start_codon:yes stop_codon:yes gene_type:complete
MRLEKGDEQYYAHKAEQRKKRVAVRYLRDIYPKAAVRVLHTERGTDEHRKAKALAEGLKAVILFLDPDGSITAGVDQ